MKTPIGIAIIVIPAVCAVLAAPASAQQWPAADLVLRTNGGVLRTGECVRLTMVAANDTPGPLMPTVSYAFDAPVTIQYKDGPRVETRRKELDRPPGAVLDSLVAGTSVVLDDTLCFGQGSAAGAYQIAVTLSSFGLSSVRLDTCVEFQPDAGEPAGACDFALRGVVRRDVPDTVTFDATVGGGGLFRLLAFQGDRLLTIIEDGVGVAGPRDLSVVGASLQALGPHPVDLVLHDQAHNRSASATRLAISR